MHAIDVMLKRRSIRKFQDKQVPWDNVIALINCALNAPIAGNVINVKFITIRDKGNREAVAKACHEQMWMAQAPLHIAVIGEPQHQKRYYGSRGEKLYTIQNCANCAMSIIIAAESVGLGSCWVGSFDEDEIRSVLGLPENVNCHCIIPIGYADEKPHAPQKQWLKASIFLEKWWAGRKWGAHGYYSFNVMKGARIAGEGLSKLGKKGEDAIKKLSEKVLKKK